MDEPRKDELDPEELDRQTGEPLPDREALSVVDPELGWRLPPIDADPSTVEPPESA